MSRFHVFLRNNLILIEFSLFTHNYNRVNHRFFSGRFWRYRSLILDLKYSCNGMERASGLRVHFFKSSSSLMLLETMSKPFKLRIWVLRHRGKWPLKRCNDHLFLYSLDSTVNPQSEQSFCRVVLTIIISYTLHIYQSFVAHWKWRMRTNDWFY